MSVLAAGREVRQGPAFAAVRVRLGLVAALVVVAAVGWWWTARQMRGMDEGPWSGLGTLGWFLAVWVVMMAAMMFPSVAPTVALYSRMTRRRSPLLPLLFALAALAWWITVDRMDGMDAGPGTDLGTLGWFVGVWVVMMAAMMFPSLAPTVALY